MNGSFKMVNTREELIQQAITLQDKFAEVAMDYKIENWLSIDLTIPQLKSLVYIRQKKSVSFKELAGALDVTPSVVTGIIDRLIGQGMVKRNINAVDRRIQWLQVTDKGKTLLDNIKQTGIKEIYGILNTLSDEDLTMLIRGLTTLIESTESYMELHHKASSH